MSSNTNIGNTPVNQGYVQLIHTGETGGIDGTLRTLYDGDGTASDLQIASNKVKINTELYIGSKTATEFIQDIVGSMFTTGSYTNITTTYDDTNGNIDLSASGEVTLTGTQTLSNKTLTSPVINTGVSGSAILDSDTMSGVSATTLSSSESIKAYVDTEVAGLVDSAPDNLNTLNELAAALDDNADILDTLLVKSANLSDLTNAGTARSNLGLGSVATLSSIAVSNITASAIQLSSESFADNDTTIMTSAAINDRIESFGYSTTTGTVTNVSVGSGLDVSNSTTTPSITLDLTELADMTEGVVAADELILLDDSTLKRKAISEITLSTFDDTGFSSGISFNGSTANGLLTYGNSTTADVESNLTFSGSTLEINNTGDWSFIKNNTNSGGLRFGTKDSGGTYANQIEISNTGNYVKLNENTTITGNVNATGVYQLDGTTIINSDGNFEVHDTRNTTPSTDLGVKGVRFDFKANSTDGLSDGGSYHGVMTFQQWNDTSGGHIHALGFTDNGYVHHRNASIGGTFGNWKKLIQEDDSGNVGIGETSVDANLHVSGSPVVFKLERPGTRAVRMGIPDNTNNFVVADSDDLKSSQRMVIDGNGDIGIGTTSTTHKLTVDSNGNSNSVVRIDADDARGASRYALDIVDDDTNGRGSVRISTTSGPSLTTTGSVGIGTSSPDTTLDITSTGANGIVLNQQSSDSNTSSRLFFKQDDTTWNIYGASGHLYINRGASVGSSSGSLRVQIREEGLRVHDGALGVDVIPSTTDGRIDAANDVVAFSTSDKRLKENIKPLDSALDKVLKISGVSFDWKELTEEEKKTIHGNEGHDVGVIAQEIEEVLPEVVTERDNGYKAVKYEKIVPLLIEAIKEQQKQIEELKNG